jgi:hypothetical protein
MPRAGAPRQLVQLGFGCRRQVQFHITPENDYDEILIQV